jgi:prepilin-type N-terminal cleavage/methylation domain-containing protein
MTIIEMLVAMAVFSIVMAGAFAVLRSESRGLRLGAERASALQNLRFAANVLELDLRTLGANVPDEQPFLVYADGSVIAFNADYATNVADDPYGVYYDPDAPTGSVTALRAAEAITVPLSAFSYPDTNYTGLGGVTNSPAETIIFYFDLDTSTARTDDYALYKQINGDAPELVSRNILRNPSGGGLSVEFFEYFRVRTPQSAPAYVEAIPGDSLPLAHSAPIHGSLADTGSVALVDSVRGVRVSFTVTNGRTGAAEHRRSIARLIRFPNAGLAVKRTCGDEPILGVFLLAAPGVNANGDPIVTLTWNQAVDEAGGERDVTRYVLWRRLLGAAEWGDPYLSIPPGNVTYTYEDQAVTPGDTYEYALAVQDCTPSLSLIATAGPVTIP